MVSTRGIKFQFSEGERVLCYEPDPTKAKVLYESKVLDLVVSRDEKGRKIAEYLIHFFGWNSSWDRCVREEFILPYTEENQDLQTKLASEAALSIKGKRKTKLPPLFKDSLNKKQFNDSGTEKTESLSDSSSERNSSEDEAETEVKLDLPDVLKKLLDEDWRCITQRNKLVKLPCQRNVIDILESYIKHLAAKLLCVSPPKNATNGKHLMPDDVDKRLNLGKETMDGIRVFFDFTLPHLLLYRQEKKQYYTEGTNCTPYTETIVSDQPEVILKPLLKEEIESPNIELTLLKTEPNIPPKRGRGRPSLRSQPIKESTPLKCEVVLKEEPKSKEESPFKSIPKSPEKTSKTNSKQKSEAIPTRTLRSTERQKHPSTSKEVTSETESQELELQVDIESPPPRVTRKSLQQNTSSSDQSPPPQKSLKGVNRSMSPPTHQLRSTVDKGSSPLHAATPTVPVRPIVDRTMAALVNLSSAMLPHSSRTLERILSPTTPHLSQSSCSVTLSNCSVRSGFLAPPSLSNCPSSSNSSSQTSQSGEAKGQHYHLINNAGLLEEVLSWHMLPPASYRVVPAVPSVVYGAPHLLRLFVKLPDLISKMNIPHKKMQLLAVELEAFISYLAEQKDELFHSSVYVDAVEEAAK